MLGKQWAMQIAGARIGEEDHSQIPLKLIKILYFYQQFEVLKLFFFRTDSEFNKKSYLRLTLFCFLGRAVSS